MFMSMPSSTLFTWSMYWSKSPGPNNSSTISDMILRSVDVAWIIEDAWVAEVFGNCTDGSVDVAWIIEVAWVAEVFGNCTDGSVDVAWIIEVAWVAEVFGNCTDGSVDVAWIIEG